MNPTTSTKKLKLSNHEAQTPNHLQQPKATLFHFYKGKQTQESTQFKINDEESKNAQENKKRKSEEISDNQGFIIPHKPCSQLPVLHSDEFLNNHEIIAEKTGTEQKSQEQRLFESEKSSNQEEVVHAGKMSKKRKKNGIYYFQYQFIHIRCRKGFKKEESVYSQ